MIATRTSMIIVKAHLSALTSIEAAIGSRCAFTCRVKYINLFWPNGTLLPTR